MQSDAPVVYRGSDFERCPLTNAPNTRLMQMYGGVAFSHRVAEQNVVSVTRSTKQRLTSITLGSKLQNTSVLNIGWCISSRSEHKREGMQLLQYLYTDREAADLCCTAWRVWTTAAWMLTM